LIYDLNDGSENILAKDLSQGPTLKKIKQLSGVCKPGNDMHPNMPHRTKALWP
jgi:hypothetical protein